MRFLSALLFLVIVAGCSKSDSSVADIAELRAQQSVVANQLAELTERIGVLEAADIDPIDYDTASEAYIGDPTQSGFSLGRTQFGRFAVSVEDISAYGAGSRIRFEIMNLSSATVTNARIKVAYGQYSFEEMIAAFKEKRADQLEAKPAPVELASQLHFPPGVWVNQVVTLPALKPDELKTVSLGFEPQVLRGRSQ